jgi:hypothetical protein
LLRREKHGSKEAFPMAIATQAPAPSIKRCVDATNQAADRVDDWIRRYRVDHPLRYRPTVFSSRQRRSAVSVRDRGVWLLAIGDSLKARYDALATPLPPHVAALVEQLEMKK